MWPSVSSPFKPAIRSCDTGQRIPCFDSCQWLWNGFPMSNYKDLSFVHKLTRPRSWPVYFVWAPSCATPYEPQELHLGLQHGQITLVNGFLVLTRIADVKLTKPVWQRSPCMAKVMYGKGRHGRRRRRRRRRQVAPASYTASHVDHEKNAWVSKFLCVVIVCISKFYRYGASLPRPFGPTKLRLKDDGA